MANEHPLKHRFLRAVVISLCWVAFAAIGFGVYATYIHDVGATFWVMQVFLLPLALPLAMLLDYLLVHPSMLAERFGLVAALDSGFAIMLWVLPIWGLALLFLVAAMRLSLLAWPRVRQVIHTEKTR